VYGLDTPPLIKQLLLAISQIDTFSFSLKNKNQEYFKYFPLISNVYKVWLILEFIRKQYHKKQQIVVFDHYDKRLYQI
jgi:hypothetical protein